MSNPRIVTLQLTPDGANLLKEHLDQSVRHGGIQSARTAIQFTDLINSAIADSFNPQEPFVAHEGDGGQAR